MHERKIDELGRIVLPIEFKRDLGISEKDLLKISLDKENKKIIIEKSLLSCLVCGSVNDLIQNQNKSICVECLEKFKMV